MRGMYRLPKVNSGVKLFGASVRLQNHRRQLSSVTVTQQPSSVFRREERISFYSSHSRVTPESGLSRKQKSLKRRTIGERLFSSAAGDAGSGSDVVFDVTEATFAELVMQQKVPVILDVHAEWCGPCKQLGPILEAAVRAQNGKVVMAKLDADANGGLTQQLRVASLPTVLAVHEGKLVDSFTGMIPEAQVKEFVSKLVSLGGEAQESPEDPLTLAQVTLEKVSENLDAQGSSTETVEILKQLGAFDLPADESGTPPTAEQKEVVKMIKAKSFALLAKCALLDGESEDAAALCDLIQKDFPDLAKTPEISQIIASIKLAGDTPVSDLKELEDSLASNPKDKETLLKIARLYSSTGDHEKAIEAALKLMRVDRSYEDDAAKNLLLDIFAVLGKDHELTKMGRRRMSSLMLV